jgi:hypothetical protein
MTMLDTDTKKKVAEDLASRFVAAYDLADRDAAMGVVADDAPFQFGAQSIAEEELGPLFALMVALEDRHDLRDVRPTGRRTRAIRCF